MKSIKVKLLRPLDGRSVGETAEYPDDDAKRLRDLGAVEFVGGKAAPAVENKMAAPVVNKADVRIDRKGR